MLLWHQKLLQRGSLTSLYAPKTPMISQHDHQQTVLFRFRNQTTNFIETHLNTRAQFYGILCTPRSNQREILMNLKGFIKRGILHETTGYVCRCMLLIHHCLDQHRADVSYALQVSMALTKGTM